MQAIADLKLILFDMLEAAFKQANNGNDINLSQQLGVNMSNTVKKDGVVIIQNQNLEIYHNIIPPMVKALKLCDAIEVSQPASQILQIQAPEPDTDTDPIEECCAFLYEQNICWEDMQDLMKARYATFVIAQKETKIEAAKMLKIQPTYLSKITTLLPKKGPKNENKKMVII